ncbi:MAG: phenylalanine--tRNA ligase subunit beta [Candidatus Ryanbacteria bacterium CG10_big_fil_rev_8_21_14_0_10_43_42]|uniref:Phenylalanine--tRNA ligase beta subunit n=1 Tax=Candidatus Ryanbacteria bacterium CG10_big_fil_rev_8_21_14_0_10_43_42 TaxID=1974864 RepID=A0A2M8KYA9_9BACT|nr:MAG: phenylalanine--tRNA ligase subunit beta [Candidatus Ryanbacteria bacterium CG10_big_fil_rev_8_21_14_0_10_43_42]
MKFSYNWLKEYIPKLPSPEKLADILTMHAFEVEEYKKHGKDYMFEIAILPNRVADASGHAGLARDIAAVTKLTVVSPKAACTEEKGTNIKDMLTVSVKNKEACTRYMARVMQGVQIKESPAWLKERLDVCGIRSINAIVDATNYIMLETGQPLHAFDYQALSGTGKKEIIVRNAKKGERMKTLDGQDVVLEESMLVIADKDDPLALAGIKGGSRAEITSNTHTIILEAAHFSGPGIRRTSEQTGIRTDASVRYSARMSAFLAEDALMRLCSLIAKISGAKAVRGVFDIYPKKESAPHIAVRPAYVNSLLGVSLKGKDIQALLKRAHCTVAVKKDFLIVTPPPARTDLRIEEDLIEEIGRIYGYDNVKAIPPRGELIPPRVDEVVFFQNVMKDILAGIGFQETYNYAFVSAGDIASMGDTPHMYLELENPARAEFQYMRAYLTPGLLRNAAENLKHESTVRMFELSSVFGTSRAKDLTHHEARHLGGFIAHKQKSKKAHSFFELKGSLSRFFEALGITAHFDDISADDIVFHPHRAAHITIDGTRIGTMGELHPIMAERFSIGGEVALFEIDADGLARLVRKEKEFRPISRYPSIMRDIAVLVPVSDRIVELYDVIENTAGELLVDTDLIDMYEGSEIPDGKKSLVFRLVFQSHEHTLKDSDVDGIMQKIMKAFDEHLEWEVRK